MGRLTGESGLKLRSGLVVVSASPSLLDTERKWLRASHGFQELREDGRGRLSSVGPSPSFPEEGKKEKRKFNRAGQAPAKRE